MRIFDERKFSEGRYAPTLFTYYMYEQSTDLQTRFNIGIMNVTPTASDESKKVAASNYISSCVSCIYFPVY